MLRKICCVLLSLLVLSPAALADLATVPTRDRFSLAYDRMQTAIKRERPLAWTVSVEPTAVDGYVDGALDVLTMMLSSLELSGAVLAFKDGGGYMQTTLRSGNQEIATFGQVTQNSRTAINLSGEWVSIDAGNEADAASKLGLDSFGASLLTMEYEGFRSGETPFLSWFETYGKRLWSLASPYARDNHGLSVPSGATSHGTSYDINTQAFRSLLNNWADELTSNGLSIGLSGTEFSIGISDEAFEGFVQRLRAFANSAELSKPLTFSLAFGEGDILGTAKGSGTLRENGKTTGISYSYRSDLSSTKVTRSYNLDFQPTTMDSLVLKCTWTTSSNKKSSGAEDVSLTASGNFDGKPYRLEVKSSMVNQYGLGDRDLLTENITGTLTASLTYDGRTIADITVSREGHTQSYQWLTTLIRINERYDVTIRNDAGTLFQGIVTVGYELEGGTQEVPDILATAVCVEDLDFIALQRLREAMSAGMADARQLLLQALPQSAMATLFQTN